ncbi:MAG: hypothetical protein N2447_02930 [Thermoanaerobaculum sp.]|nr:hypothetical protein [Thermoanaerobaculum sp.]
MRGMGAMVVVLILGLGVGWAQEEPSFQVVENPFQEEYALKLGEPVKLYVEVEGTRFADFTLTPQGNVEPGKTIKAQVMINGTRTASSRAEIVPVFLLEDANGKSLERVSPAPFKVRGSRPFEYRDTVNVSGDALAAAAKVWVYLEIR